LTPLIRPEDHPLDRVAISLDEILRLNPQREEFLQLESILHLDLAANLIVGHRRLRADEFWVRGHLPGRPLFPGVLMCETMAQAASIHAHKLLGGGGELFFGFGAIERARFRATVSPPADLWVAGRITKSSARRPYFAWEGQLLRDDATIVATAHIVGVGM